MISLIFRYQRKNKNTENLHIILTLIHIYNNEDTKHSRCAVVSVCIIIFTIIVTTRLYFTLMAQHFIQDNLNAKHGPYQ